MESAAAHTNTVSAAVSHPSGPSNFHWTEADGSSSIPHFTEPWNPLDHTWHFTEWLDPCGAEDDIPDSMVASTSSASGVTSMASSASMDSLGLHHLTTFGVTDVDEDEDGYRFPMQTIYDRTDFVIASESRCSHHELSELDITLIPPSSGTLVNWKSPTVPCCMLGQKRPRDTELDELADRYKRRRMLELRV